MAGAILGARSRIAWTLHNVAENFEFPAKQDSPPTGALPSKLGKAFDTPNYGSLVDFDLEQEDQEG